MKTYILIALFLTTASAFACGDMTTTKEDSSSVALETAKRVVHANIAEEHIPARAYGWSYWMVQKYKKSARYQIDADKDATAN